MTPSVDAGVASVDVGAPAAIHAGSALSDVGVSPSVDAGAASSPREEVESVVSAAVALVDGGLADLPEGTEFSLNGMLSLTPFGSVKLDGKLIGFVGHYPCKTRVFANCHMHPKCAIQCGIARRPVSRLKLAEWLATGVPCPDLTRQQRLEAGATHRLQWSRDGPLGDGTRGADDVPPSVDAGKSSASRV